MTNKERLEEAHNKPIKQILIEAYRADQNFEDLADTLRVSVATVHRWIRQNRLKIHKELIEQ